MNQKKIEDFIYFGAKTIEYNLVTSNSDIKMDMTIVYPLKSPKFKYLDHLDSNIKLQTNYFVSELIRFSKSGKIIIETIDIDYLKTSAININQIESSSLAIPNASSIIDLIDDNFNLTQEIDIENNNLPDSVNLEDEDYEKQSDNYKKTVESDNKNDFYNEFEENQKLHSKKRKRNTTKPQKEKGKKVRK
ncbi:137_t:CDS:2 [Dentiscutata erythropus]|uniref:137_t:CDS:1 n=1 Tax=Dentiscutata erythropus TaxID=1348616 RepID=A0A9N8WG51_9GLOM|nr:137_t:CDS:2 [Dentiscutata erythropus]